MEPVRCGFCKDGLVDQLGELYHTKIKDRTIAAHHKCMQYSSGLTQWKFDHFGGFKVDEVKRELKRGGELPCSRCGTTGATAGCALSSCQKTYHFPCAPRPERIEIRHGKNRGKITYRVFCTKEDEKIFKNSECSDHETVEVSSAGESEDSDAEPSIISDGKPKKRGRGGTRGTSRKKICGSRQPSNKEHVADTQTSEQLSRLFKIVEELQQRVDRTEPKKRRMVNMDEDKKQTVPKKDKKRTIRKEKQAVKPIKKPRKKVSMRKRFIRNEGVDPKSVLCAFFKQGQCGKGAKCVFSHDLNISRKEDKINVNEDVKDDEADRSIDEDDNGTVCCKCHRADQPELMLLCDNCNAGYHTACLQPPLMKIPDGNWFCPPCEQENQDNDDIQCDSDVEPQLSSSSQSSLSEEFEESSSDSLDSSEFSESQPLCPQQKKVRPKRLEKRPRRRELKKKRSCRSKKPNYKEPDELTMDVVQEDVSLPKRSRTKKDKHLEARRSIDEDDNGTVCCKCHRADQPELMLLCDNCNAGYHTACLQPPLMKIPAGYWYCPTCKQVPHDEKEILKDILMDIHKKLKAKDVKGFFAEPITDTIAPGYSKRILDPMDFSTMESKIERNEYGSIMGYKKDFELMCKNAMTYNRPETIYYKEAKRLLKLLQGCVEQRIKVPVDEKGFLKEILMYIHKKLKSKDVNEFFGDPITNTIAPGYSDIIREPMDFSTMESKIETNEYGSIMDYKKDFVLMCENAMTYNSPETIYYKEAKRLLRLLQGCIEQRIKLNEFGETPLHTACIKGDLECVKELVKKGHEVNAKDNLSWTPLHEAANRNYVEIVGYLLDNGADIDPQGGDDLETPLIDAASNGHIDTMKLLIEKGADCKLRDKKGETARDVLTKWTKPVNISDLQERQDDDDFQLITDDESESGSSKSSYSENSEESNSGSSDISKERVRPEKKARRDDRRARRREQKERSCRSKKPNYKEPDELTMDVAREDVSSPKKSRTKTDKHQGKKYYKLDALEKVLLQSKVDYEEQNGIEQRLKENCTENGLEYHGQTPGNGDCFFEAIASQLRRIGANHSSSALLRKQVAEYIQQHPTYEGQAGTVSLESFIEGTIEDYCNKMAKKGTWADNIVIVNMAKMLGHDIMIVTSSPSTSGNDCLVWVSGDRTGKNAPLLLGHLWENHYQSLQPLEQTDSPLKRKEDVDGHLKRDRNGVGPIKQLSTSSTSSRETLYRWDKATSLRNMADHPKRKEEEKEKLLKWLRLRLVCSYHTDIYPSRHAHSLYPMEEILFSERFSNSVTVELCNELTKNKSNNNSEILVRCIDGASREVIKYKEFVKKAIIAISNIRMYKEIFFIISVDRSDKIDTLSDLVPDNFIESQVFTAFNPEKVQPSCILIHIKGIGLQTLTCYL